ncbi:MAG TPA: type II secretion system protein [Terriglobales bacterium]|nr:type II secretion system protein [Terriglobales bacterium]
MRTSLKSQRGFSLIEIMVVMLILTIVMGVLFAAINQVQKRYRTEEQRVDVMQNAREFVDQIGRDLHNSGYPNNRMYAVDKITSTSNSYWYAAKGLVAASSTEIILDGDMEGLGTSAPGGTPVSVIRYKLEPNASGSCPCTLRRSAVGKPLGGTTNVEAMPYAFNAEVENVVNSTGGGASAWTIAGNAPGGASNDTVYGNYKINPVFQFLDKNGGLVSGVPATLAAGNMAAGKTAADSTAMIVVTLSVMGPTPDMDTKRRPVATMRTTLNLPNR